MGEIFHSRPWITAEDEAAVREVLHSGQLAQGDTTTHFERQMAGWLGLPEGVAVGSGGAAIEIALLSLGAGPETEVVIPTYVCRTVLDAVMSTGATPVLCDVGSSWVVEAANIAPLLTHRTRAVIVPHLYGIFADIAAIRKLGCPVIEDAAQALGTARQHAVPGDLVVLSFHPTKCLTTGEGGMVLGSNPALIARCRGLRDSGEPPQAWRRRFSPLSDISAALGLSQLARYPEFLRRRAAIATRYHDTLSPITGIDLGGMQVHPTMFFRFVLKRGTGLSGCQEAFIREGVHVRRGVDRLLHRMLNLDDRDFPVAISHFNMTVSLPIHPSLSSQELESCLRASGKIFGGHA